VKKLFFMPADTSQLPSSALRPQSPNSGFALVIALSLMAFVLLLMLSITTLVRVETSGSETNQQRLLAENNALLGVHVALGSLQVATGPDQRITANAAIRDAAHPSKANYTVVWDSDVLPGAVGAPLAWLVSGGDEPAFSEAAAVDTSWPDLVSARKSGTVEAVKAAPVAILDSTNVTTGEIAWWVGDEGVKAKFNLAESSYLRDPLTDPNLRFGTVSRSGIEALDDFNTLYDYADDRFVAGLRKTISADQGGVLEVGLAAPLRDHFHDLSFHSRGLLANTRDGGLKQDLTHYFEGALGGPSGPISPGGSAALDRITWEQLQSFYDLADERAGNTITARAQEADAHGVYPLLTMLHLNFGFTMESNYSGGAPTTPADRAYQVHGHLRPWFVLSNPYTTELSVSNYRIRFNQFTGVKFKVSYNEPGVGVTDLIDESFDDVLENMVFVVPQVTLEPGEALYFTLDPNDNGGYGYSFNVGTGGFYAPYAGYQSNTPQQFVFTPADDAGLTSIRLDGTATITGDLIEDGNATNPRIRQMYVSVDNVGAYWLRTYLGDSAALGDNEQILQDIGRFGVAGIARDNQYGTYHGYWSIDSLPENLAVFDGFVALSENRDPGETMRSTALSFTYAMHSAINQDVDLLYSGYGGWATDYNIRAPRMGRYKDSQRHPAAYDFIERPNGSLWFTWITDPNLGDAPRFPWGAGYSRTSFPSDDPAARVLQSILFDIPRVDLTTNQPAVASLGQLQHFNAGGWTEDTYVDDAALDAMSYAPSNAIGNSYAPPQVPRDETTASDGGATFSDVAYLLNDALYDEFFFSSIPQSSGAVVEYDKLPNKRLIPKSKSITDAAVRSSGTAAAENLFIDGAFNVNSVSVDAWYSLLNSFRGFDFGGKVSGQGIFPRSLNQLPQYVEGDVDGVANDDESWAGWRHVEDDLVAADDRKLRKLAEAIVDEVKARGPFVSMSDFVNRRLVTNSDSNARFGLSGALQSAADRTLNADFNDAYKVNPDKMASREPWENPGTAGRLDREGVVDVEHLGSGPIKSLDGSSTLADATSASAMPAWVLQADLLQALAPVLSVRSDTFTIRSYGNSRDPLTGEVFAERYVEAVVQRNPRYVDPSDGPEIDPNVNPLSATNQLAGRKFSIIDIRFLDKSAL
jgi:hypothetical protein